jgi:hypothetical protein
MDKNPNEFRLLNQQLEHLKKIVSRYKEVEEWENLTFGDQVYIANSDSIHHKEVGKFITHQWSSSGYVCLLVEFEDGSRHYYLPIHVLKHFDVEPMTAKDLEPLRATPAPVPKPEPKPEPEPEKQGIDFLRYTPEKLEAASERIIEAKLEQVCKIPNKVAREKVLSSTLDAGLVPRALELAKERGIIPG